MNANGRVMVRLVDDSTMRLQLDHDAAEAADLRRAMENTAEDTANVNQDR